MKKIIFFISVFLVVFLIYYLNVNKKVYYLSIGDYLSYGINNFEKTGNGYSDNIKNSYKSTLENYVNYSSYDDFRVMDLMNDINYNKTIKIKNKEYKIQNLLVKANLITLSIGMNDLIYKKKIRKYNKDEIYFLGFYDAINNIEIIEYSNNRLKNICKKEKINYIDISNLKKYIINGYYPTNDGYKYIADMILNFTNNKK